MARLASAVTLIVLIALAAVGLRADDPKPETAAASKPYAEPGFTPIFNGHDLTGWVYGTKNNGMKQGVGYQVDPAQGVKIAPPAVARAADAAPPTTKGFIAFEPMVGITNALNLAQKGIYKELQVIPAGGSWEESFWVTTKGY